MQIDYQLGVLKILTEKYFNSCLFKRPHILNFNLINGCICRGDFDEKIIHKFVYIIDFYTVLYISVMLYEIELLFILNTKKMILFL
jgi:hypothetical protein